MMTDEFQRALAELAGQAVTSRIAIMCAERLPWRCHRHFIADSLVARGVTVLHLIDSRKRQEHHLNPMVRTVSGKLLYDGHEQLGLDLRTDGRAF